MVPSPEFPGEYVLASGRDRMPLSYTLRATADAYRRPSTGPIEDT